MKHKPKDVHPMPGFISLRRVVKNSSIIELTDDQKQEIASIHIDAMGTGTEDMTEARVDDEITFIFDQKESSSYGNDNLDMKHHRILIKPENITAVLTPKKNSKVN